MTKDEEIRELRFAIKLTESCASRACSPTVMNMHLNAIKNYQKRLDELEDKCYTCEKPCVKCVRSDHE